MRRKLPYLPRVKNYRWDRQMSQRALAELVGISTRALMDIENSRRVPSLVVAMKIAYHLNANVENLFTKFQPGI